jgi:phage shock protein E
VFKAVSLIFSSLVLAACGSSDGSAQSAFAAVKEGALLIDVRTAEEFAGGHLPGAINIPHGEILAGVNALQADQSAAMVLYCRSGNRSGMATKSLSGAGFSNVVNAGAYSSLKPVWDAGG